METFEIIDITEDGKGIAKKDSLVYFIKGAKLGDTVKIKNIKEKKNYILAEVAEFKERSKYRITSMCNYFPRCQNCAFQDLEYERELEFKKNKVLNNLKRIGNIEDIEDMCREDIAIVGSDTSGYRNKVTLKVKDGKIGYFKRKTNELVEIKRCDIANDRINEIIKIISEEYINYLKYFSDIMIRVIDNNIQIELTVDAKYNAEEVLKNEKEKLEELKNDILKQNEVDSNIQIYLKDIKNNTFLAAAGDDIKIEFLGKKYYVHPNSFFQVNKKQAEKIYSDILKELKKQDTKNNVLIDMYSGVGVSTVLFSSMFEKVIAIENNVEAVEMADRNAILNGVDNSKNILGKAEDEISKLDIPKNSYVFVDPPRSGLDKKVINKITQSGVENIVYMSCNSSSLARDLKIFKENMYDIQKIAIYDMFPRTLHVEVITQLSKLDSKKYISVELPMDDMYLTSAESKATYKQIQNYVLEKFGFEVSALYIAQVKKKHGLEVREHYNISKNEKQKIPQCPIEKEEAILDALKHFKMVYY